MSYVLVVVALTLAQQFTQPNGPPPASLRMLDVTSDGLPDRLELTEDGLLRVAVNLGGRVFDPFIHEVAATPTTDILVSDFNGDGRLDLYLVSPVQNLALMGDGSGRFRDATESLGLGDGGVGSSAERIDLDGDSHADLLLHNETRDVIFWSVPGVGFERDSDSSDHPSPAGGPPSPGSGWDDSDDSGEAGDPHEALSGGSAGGNAIEPAPFPAGGPGGSPGSGPSVGGLGQGTLGAGARADDAVVTDNGKKTPPPTIIFPPLESVLDDKYVNDEAGEVGPADIVDGTLTGGDISTSGGNVTFAGPLGGSTLTVEPGTETPTIRVGSDSVHGLAGAEGIKVTGEDDAINSKPGIVSLHLGGDNRTAIEGVSFNSNNGTGVLGTAGMFLFGDDGLPRFGVRGVAETLAGHGVKGEGGMYGVHGTTWLPGGVGVYGRNYDNGVAAHYGVYGEALGLGGYGVYGDAPTGWAVFAEGDLGVTGTLDAQGDLGVAGTLDAQGDLDVAGTLETPALRLTTGPTDGYVLTADADGNASWNAPPDISGNQGFLPKFDGSSSLEDSSIQENGSGRVSIGNTNPSDKKLNVRAELSEGLSKGAHVLILNDTGVDLDAGAYGLRAEFLSPSPSNHDGVGLWGLSDGQIGTGVRGEATNDFGPQLGPTYGVHGIAAGEYGRGVFGEATWATPGVLSYGVYGSGGSHGVYGEAAFDGGIGVSGWSTDTTGSVASHGVRGSTSSPHVDSAGVLGFSSSRIGVSGSGGDVGVKGTASTGTGVIGESTWPSGIGVVGNGATGVSGESSSAAGIGILGAATSATGATIGVQGTADSPDGRGVAGHSSDGVGMYGYTFDGIGVHAVRGSGTTGYAIVSDGDVAVTQGGVQVGNPTVLYSSGVTIESSGSPRLTLQASGAGSVWDLAADGGDGAARFTRTAPGGTLTALRVKTDGDVEVAGSLQATGLTIPTGAVASYVLKSDANGAGTWQPDLGVMGLGSSGRVPAWTGSMTLGDSDIYVDQPTGHVGIGTPSSTTYQLKVNNLDGGETALFLSDGLHIGNSGARIERIVNDIEIATDSTTRITNVGGAFSLSKPTLVVEGEQSAVFNEPTMRIDGGVRTLELTGAGTHLRSVGSGSFVLEALPSSGPAYLTIDGAGDIDTDGDIAAGGGITAGGDVTSAGRMTCTELEITGADLAEAFDAGAWREPGTVLVIDPDRPGALTVTTTRYDKRVAGVVSGAGGVPHGIYLGRGGALDGDTLVAMAGRVYVKCSAEGGPIQPGDLLTTSGFAGHAMRARDSSRSAGSVLGKAMGHLDEGTGLVLVLVNLQ
jgi:hypothetical protein